VKTIAIVGAGPQLGLAIAKRFGREGFNVGLISRSEPKLQAMVDQLSGAGIEAAAFPADARKPDTLQAALASVEERFGPIDVLEFSPAPTGIDADDRPVVEATQVTIESVLPELEMYVLGGIAAIGYVLPRMRQRRSGTILVTTGSGSGRTIVPEVANVQVATGGLRNWVLNLHAALRGEDVYVAHVAIDVPIGAGFLRAEPDTIANAYWDLYQQRDTPELFYEGRPDDWDVASGLPWLRNQPG
jgi:NAD(P)-dependent dehydrogenase (short-subunit alcohol dehydrogenase family)